MNILPARSASLLIPVGLDPGHPVSAGANKSLKLHCASSRDMDAFGRENEIGPIVKVRVPCPRQNRMPRRRWRPRRMLFVKLVQHRACACGSDLFPGREVTEFPPQFRVTLHSGLAWHEEMCGICRTGLGQGLQSTAITDRRGAWRFLRPAVLSFLSV